MKTDEDDRSLVLVDRNSWIDQVREDYSRHPALFEIVAFCLMCFRDDHKGVSPKKAERVLLRALQIFSN